MQPKGEGVLDVAEAMVRGALWVCTTMHVCAYVCMYECMRVCFTVSDTSGERCSIWCVLVRKQGDYPITQHSRQGKGRRTLS